MSVLTAHKLKVTTTLKPEELLMVLVPDGEPRPYVSNFLTAPSALTLPINRCAKPRRHYNAETGVHEGLDETQPAVIEEGARIMHTMSVEEIEAELDAIEHRSRQ